MEPTESSDMDGKPEVTNELGRTSQPPYLQLENFRWRGNFATAA